MSNIKGLLPSDDYIILVDRDKKKAARKDKSIQYEFEVDLFVPAEIFFTLVGEWDNITALFSGFKIDNMNSLKAILDNVVKTLKKDKGQTLRLCRKAFSEIFQPQYSFMDYEWCKKNISMSDFMPIIKRIINPVLDGLVENGFIQLGEVPEAEKPEKNPKGTEK